MDRKSGSAVGLDIGSTAVRAVELTRSRKGLALDGFGQVGLPRGAVVDGEIVDGACVAAALRRLWSEGNLKSRNVVLAVSGQRVIVRQAEVLSMSESEFRSALTFQAMELIPIPVDDAQLDFVILPRDGGVAPPGDHMKIVLAAAHRRVVDSHLAVLRDASLRAVAVDPAPMALARAVARSAVGTAAVVDIGGDLTVITIVEAGHVRFSRILNAGGNDLTARIAGSRSVDEAEAEAIKRRGSSAGAGSLLVDDLDPLIAEIESSLTFFATQLTGDPVEQVFVTGGASRDSTVVSELARRLPVPLQVFDPLNDVSLSEAVLDGIEREAFAATSLVAVGAAGWAWESPGTRLSLLPRGVAAAAQMRRRVLLAAAGLVVVAAGLSAASLARHHQVDVASREVAAVNTENAGIGSRVATLAPIVATHARIQQRLSVVGDLGQGDVAWSALLARITAAMPPKLHLTALTFSGPGASAAGGASSTAASTTSGASAAGAEGGAGPLGSVTMSVTGTGTEEEIAIWLRAFRDVPGLEAVWVPGATSSGGKVQFTSSGGLSSHAPLIHRTATGAAS